MEPAVFFDGRSSRRHLVTLAFADRLEIADAAMPGGALLAAWPYGAVRRVDGPVGTLRLACAAAPPLARLELRGADERTRIAELCPALDGPGSAASVSIWRIAAASLAAAAAIFLMAWFGMPLLADRLATALPFSWEAPIGDALDPRVRALFGAACQRPSGVAAVRKLVDRLEAAAQLPIKPDPVVLRSRMANAFAVPGGRVYLLSRLLTLAQTPDELAGVLAHELGHVDHRDGLRRLIRNGGTSFLVGMMFGDVTGAGAVLLAGRMVLSARYSRADEQSADQFAVAVMQRLGRPTAPMGALLQRMTGPADANIPALLRDHPLTPEREAMLQAASRSPSGPDLLDPSEWRDLKSICNR